jgi:hypothetical protein
VFGDTERPDRVRREQDHALRFYVRRQVYPYSSFNRNRLSAAGIGPLGVREAADLRRVPTVTWADVGDGGDLVLRPHKTTITRLGSPSLAFRVLFATLLGRRHALNRTIIDPIYKPIHWLIQGGVPVGVTANDLERLSEIGRRWLEAAGVGNTDLVASIIPAGPNLDYLQLLAGTRRAGVPVAFLETAPALQDVMRVRPTVLAGRSADLVALAELAAQPGSPALAEVRTILVTGEVADEASKDTLARLLGRDIAILSAWAPPGVRALWAECRGGDGLHTWPAAELVDVIDPASNAPVPSGTQGEVVWSALGWAGSVVLRMRTGVRAVLDESTCPVCHRTTPRVKPVATVAPFAPILDGHPGVAAWQGELSRRNGSEELVVFLVPSRPGHPGRLVRDLDRRLEPARPATQFVVLSREQLESRLAAHAYNRFVDRRPECRCTSTTRRRRRCGRRR